MNRAELVKIVDASRAKTIESFTAEDMAEHIGTINAFYDLLLIVLDGVIKNQRLNVAKYLMQGMLSGDADGCDAGTIKAAVQLADALIAEVDKGPAAEPEKEPG